LQIAADLDSLGFTREKAIDTKKRPDPLHAESAMAKSLRHGIWHASPIVPVRELACNTVIPKIVVIL
jgi:hypothetical protein